MAPGPVKFPENLLDLPLQDRIRLLNAFSKIRGRSEKICSGIDEDIRYIVSREFDLWVDAQMRLLLGESRPATPGSAEVFTKEESQALRALAQKILETQSGLRNMPLAETPSSLPQKSKGQRPSPPPQGGGDPVNSQEWRRAQENFLAQLDRMDRDADGKLEESNVRK